jgi:tetratricopeptide (TPR) repeat protein
MNRHCAARVATAATEDSKSAAWVALCLSVWCGIAGCRASVAQPAEPRSQTLEPARQIRAQIMSDDEPHRYRVALAAGHAVRVLIHQHDADLMASLSTPETDMPRTIDSRDHGIESVTVLGPGEVTLAVRMASSLKLPSSYSIEIPEPARPATERDRLRARTEQLATTTKELMRRPDGAPRAKALELLGDLRSRWRELDDPAGEIATLAMIGDAHHAEGQLDAAETSYDEALTLSRAIHDQHAIAELANNLGVLDWRRGRISEATAHYNEALINWRALSIRSGIAATQINLGNLLFETAAYQQALEQFLAAIKLVEGADDAKTEAYALNNIGVTYQALGDLDAALMSLSRAVSRFRSAGEVAAEARAHLRVATIHLARGDTRQADAALAVARDPARWRSTG